MKRDPPKTRGRGPEEKPGGAPREKPKEDDVSTAALRKELEALKRRLAEKEKEEAEGLPKEKKRKAKEKDEKKKPLEGGGFTTLPLGKQARLPGSPPSDPSSDETSSEESGKSKKKDPKERRKRKRSKSRKSSREPKGDKEGKDKKEKKKKKKEKKEKKKKKKEKDKGPFGIAKTEEWSKCESSHTSGSEESSSSRSGFRNASGGMGHHLRLVAYAKKCPGRLAVRLLRKMGEAVGFSSGANLLQSPTSVGAVPASAHLYYLAVMTPQLPGGPAAPRDLLPISPEGISKLAGPWTAQERDWLVWICLVVNFWYCSGWDKPSGLEHLNEISQKQEGMLKERLWPSVQRLCEGNPLLPTFEEIIKEMGRKGQDYDGSTWVVMETLEVEKVVACWPSKETAAIQPIARYLTGEAKKQLECPMSTILPHDQWPAPLTKSYVRASDEVWANLVAEGYKRGLFQACPEEEILRGPHGEKILNGAGAVPKEKHGKQLQRFISIFCPLNEVSIKVQGDESTLPYVGQVLLLNVPRKHEVLIDSEDMESAFNLFLMPEGFRGLFCYEKQVPGTCLGLDSSDPTWVSLRTVPMGWLSAVGIVQAAIRHLAFVEAGLPLEAEVRKGKAMPKKEKFLLYLDSVDQLRVVSKKMADKSRSRGLCH